MASYDLDRFRAFVISPSFNESYVVPVETMAEIVADDERTHGIRLQFPQANRCSTKNSLKNRTALSKNTCQTE